MIVSDPDAAPTITGSFGPFATGRYSLKALVTEANGEGLKLRGRKLCSSVVHQILRKRLYTGDLDWDGRTYTGSHEPLVTRESWQRVQELLDARAENRTRKVKHDFEYTGLVDCGHCGCLLVGELKNGSMYTTTARATGECEEPYTRQEILAREFLDKLDGRITQAFFDKQSVAWRLKQDGRLRKIQDVQKATPAPIDQALKRFG